MLLSVVEEDLRHLLYSTQPGQPKWPSRNKILEIPLSMLALKENRETAKQEKDLPNDHVKQFTIFVIL